MALYKSDQMRPTTAMSTIHDQVHARFKLFAGTLEAGNSLATLAAAVEGFAASSNVAPKSIGVEYLEHSKRVLISLGYRDDEPAYAIRLHTVSLGRASALDAGELQRIEERMAVEAAKLSHVICHELFVTEHDEFLMVFMTLRG